jgi:hypothetical protein
MTRLKQAWLALCGKLEPEVREVEVAGRPVNVEPATLYRVDCEYSSISRMVYDKKASELHGTHHLSCEAAFAAIEGISFLHVESVQALRVGEMYFRKGSELPMAAKPKIAKGKRK